MDSQEGASGTHEAYEYTPDNSDAESNASDNTPTGIRNLRKRLRVLQTTCQRCKNHLETLKKRTANALERKAAHNHLQIAHGNTTDPFKKQGLTKRALPMIDSDSFESEYVTRTGLPIMQNALVPAVIACGVDVGPDGVFKVPRNPVTAFTITLTTNTINTTTTTTTTATVSNNNYK